MEHPTGTASGTEGPVPHRGTGPSSQESPRTFHRSAAYTASSKSPYSFHALSRVMNGRQLL